MKQWLGKLLDGESLAADEAEAAFDLVMAGQASPEEIAALLTAMRVRGETPAEVAGGVRALRTAMRPLDLPLDGLVDTCGTGGGDLTTFNISTAAALVAAGGGVRIAKHGNRSFTSRCGSADVLEALGVRIDLEPALLPEVFDRVGFVFMFAPAHHPAMRHVGPVRAALGVTTIMNVLGPLASPARVRRQVVGVAHPRLLWLVGDALRELGHERALVVHGAPGLDELSPVGPTRVVSLDRGELAESEVLPADLGWTGLDARDLAGGEPAENAIRIESVLRAETAGAARAAVLLNAAAAFFAAGAAESLAQGLELAETSIEEGAARAKLEELREVTQRMAAESEPAPGPS